MDWQNERYIRLYTRDTVEWEMLPWQSRALWPLLLRKVDRIGYLPLGRHGFRGLAALVKLPPEVVEPGLEGLLEDGCVVKLEDKAGGEILFVPNFVPAQEAPQSDRARKAKQRELERARALAMSRGVPAADESGQPVTNGDDAGPPVTSRDESSRVVTSSHEAGRKVTNGHTPSQVVTPSLTVLNNPPTPLADAGGFSEGLSAEDQDPEPPDEPSYETQIAARVTERINAITGRMYPPVPELMRRIRQGVTEEELLRVVEYKAEDPFFRERHFARFKPSTLFGRKFEEYLGEATMRAAPASPPSGYRPFAPEDVW